MANKIETAKNELIKEVVEVALAKWTKLHCMLH